MDSAPVTSVFSTLWTVLFIVSVLGAMVLGGWLVLKFYVPAKKDDKPDEPPEPRRPRHPEPWEPGPYGPDPWSPTPKPQPPVGPAPAPSPQTFNPVLSLLSATPGPNRTIKATYSVTSATPLPVSTHYFTAFDIKHGDKTLTSFPQDETLEDVQGNQHAITIDIVNDDDGKGGYLDAKSLTISGRIMYDYQGARVPVGNASSVNVS